MSETSINELDGLNVRPYNLLVENGYRTIQAVCACTEKQLRAIDGLGPASLKNIKDTLSNVGLSLSGSGGGH